MKRLLSAVIAAVLIVPLFGAAVQAKEAMSYDELMVKVEQTNTEINMEIEKAIDQANALVVRYEGPLMIAAAVENPKAVIDKLDVVNKELSQLSSAYNISKTSINTVKVSSSIDDLKNKLSNVIGQTNLTSFKTSIFSEMIYSSFDRELDKIINNLVNVTNRLAQELIREATLSGFVIESEWIPVEIGGRVILIDPCRVVGI